MLYLLQHIVMISEESLMAETNKLYTDITKGSFQWENIDLGY